MAAHIPEVIPIAILFSQVKVQSADQSETFLISGIPKEYDDLTESDQLEWSSRTSTLMQPSKSMQMRISTERAKQ